MKDLIQDRQAALQIVHLSHRYGEHEALKDLTFSVKPGSILGLLGPNGGGKTTTFRLASTLMPIQTGKIFILGKDVSREIAEVRSKIGIVFQSPSLDKKLTVYENLMHQGHLYGIQGTKLRKKINELLEEFRLEDRRKDLTEKLSGGLKRRLEIAKGLLHEPEILLLDEPSTGIDPGARLDLWNYLKRLQAERHVTIIVTTHLMEEAEHCDVLGILDKGKLVAYDSPAKLKAAIGGTVIHLESQNASGLYEKLKKRFGSGISLIEGSIQIEGKKEEEIVLPLMREYSQDITSFTVQKPSIEDVFVRLTGHKFWTSPETEEKKAS